MKKLIARILSLALCAAMLCTLPVLATKANAADAAEAPASTCVWGTVTKLDDGGLLVQNSSEDAPYQEIVLHGESILFLDAVSGMPLDRELNDGETIYAWIGSTVTSSLPPHATAQIIVANIPADGSVPQYYEIAKITRRVSGTPTAEGGTAPATEIQLVTTSGQEFTVTSDAALFPYLTKQAVSLDSLRPGSRIMVWTDTAGDVDKVMLFAYDYQGYLSWDEAGTAMVNGQALSVGGKVLGGEILLPIRAVAEAAGYTANWTSAQGAIVTQSSGTSVFTILPGTNTAVTASGQRTLSGSCYLENGTTYLPAADLARLLDLFCTY